MSPQSCPYCGAAVKLNFCVSCGRQPKPNIMGSIRSSARNTDITTRIDEPLKNIKNISPQSLRARKSLLGIIQAILGGIVLGLLIFCAVKMGQEFCQSNEGMKMWSKSHRFIFFGKTKNEQKLPGKKISKPISKKHAKKPYNKR